ncbi:MAG: hypothetical protein HOP31_06810 [Ignavibacteria bacterium]|nr:hypothetical protein [Ignavibacteria bacterium]
MITKLFFILISNLLLCNLQFSQNITNTLGINGTFTIKNGSTNYLNLSQSTGQVNILKTLRLENTINSTTGVIFKGVDKFIHNYYPGTSYNTFMGINTGNFTLSTANYNTGVGSNSLSNLISGSGNTALGYESLLNNTTGYENSAFGVGSLYSNIDGFHNSAFGNWSLYANTTGAYNSAFGFSSLYSNTDGWLNSAFGYSSLSSNTNGNENSAFGYFSLSSNTTGSYNSAFGYESLTRSTTGERNSAFGYQSLTNNTGERNSAFGYYSLGSNTTGVWNSAFGYQSLNLNTMGVVNSAFGYASLNSNTTGSNNSAFGYLSLSSNTTGTNNTGIGYNAQVPSGTANNQVRIGNTSVTYAGVQVAWTITSDRRWKSNISNSNLGLSFINKLRPVTYTRNNDESGKTEYGVIAQEVEEVLKSEGVENTGMLTVTDEGMYELRYNDLIAPMIKAIQELKAENDKLKNNNDRLSAEVESLRPISSKLAKLEQLVIELSVAKNVSLKEK